MGGRGASGGMSVDKYGNPIAKYGSEYRTLYQKGNIKFVQYNGSTAAKTPMETMAKGRIYVTVTTSGILKSITKYDKKNKRYKQIDLTGQAHLIDGEKIIPHSHLGYIHDEHGTRVPSDKDKKLIDKVRRIWNNRHSR